MMWTEQPGHDEVDARRARFDLRARREPALSGTSVTVGGQDQPPLAGWIEFPTPPLTASAPACEINLDRDERIPFAGETHDRRRARGGLVLSVVAAFIGLASIGMAAGYFLFGPQSTSSPPLPQALERSPGVANSSKGDRLPVHQTTIREIDRTAPVKSPHRPHAVAPTMVTRPKPSPAVVAPPPSANTHLAAAQSPASTTINSAAKPNPETPLVPVPETRPTTIDGWTLREVVDGTAVVEGPAGAWRVRRGDTLPGVGKVIGILRWGNRLIVATNRGLISTP